MYVHLLGIHIYSAHEHTGTCKRCSLICVVSVNTSHSLKRCDPAILSAGETSWVNDSCTSFGKEEEEKDGVKLRYP